MKKIISSLILALTVCSSLFAESSGNKMLVVYFSRAGENWQVGVVERGNTAIMVDYIQEYADVDVFEVKPVVPYPEGYQDCIDYVTDEINRNDRPAYVGDITNINDYDVVFIGGPIWWSRPPMILRTFIEAHPELASKRLVPFGTHGGSGVSSYTSLLKEYFPDATVLQSLGISGASIRNQSSKATVENWLKELGLDSSNSGIQDIMSDQENASNGYNVYSLDGRSIMTQADNIDGLASGIYIINGKKILIK